MMKVFIVEDETAAFENLKDMLTKVNPQIVITGNTESIVQTVNWLQKNPVPDLIFLDIHLSDGSAFSIFDILPVEIPIIFTTAYDEYAIEAFKVNSIDYILKPLKETDLVRALNKFNKLGAADRYAQIEQINTISPQLRYRDKLLMPNNDQLIPVNVYDISCFYTTDKRTCFYK
ncbi:response regulator [Chryseobacterium sp. 09-1422]|uniref:Response regulator n=1 Tax=Chryseobacterium kimseyorum TaxID=2984028 RepID=A0ABT3I3M2_9FLAO|nr:response regulator [Chryseobacterium kimseyorum]MCW3170670.1 response regulator [Chryseobacterium kimseyorum]